MTEAIKPGSEEWHAQVNEDVLEASLPIVDPHHHLWRDRGGRPYLLEDLWNDTSSGHRIEKTVFVECRASYRKTGPRHLRPIGETEFVAEIANLAKADPGRAQIAGIVAHADLRHEGLDQVLDQHEEAAAGLFRGIRHAGARDPHPEALTIPGRAPEGLFSDSSFRRGVARLGERGFTYDSLQYHHQLRDFAELARAVPETTLILDHFGTPLGVGPYRSRQDDIHAQWRRDVAEVARCPNTVAKLGGLAMPDNGFGWHQRSTPATSDELVAAQRQHYLHTIDCFGPNRCMFESNFPVDRLSISYRSFWNACKKLTADFSTDERDALFRRTAERVYKI